jgi:hypothetical protein
MICSMKQCWRKYGCRRRIENVLESSLIKRRSISYDNNILSELTFNPKVFDSPWKKKTSSFRQRRQFGTKDTSKSNVKIVTTTTTAAATNNDKEKENVTTKQIQTSRPYLKDDDNPDEIATNTTTTTTTTMTSSKQPKRRPSRSPKDENGKLLPMNEEYSCMTKSNTLENQDDKNPQKEKNKSTNLKYDTNDNLTMTTTTTKETTLKILQPSKVFAKFLENHPTVLSTRPSYSKLHRASHPDHIPIVTRTKHSNIPILDATHLLSSAPTISGRPWNVHISNQQQIQENDDNYRRTNILTWLRKQEQIPRLSRTYLLQGHGIPYQLLNDHIQCAATLLRTHDDAMNCTFHGNSNGTLGSLSVDGYVSMLFLDVMASILLLLYVLL